MWLRRNTHRVRSWGGKKIRVFFLKKHPLKIDSTSIWTNIVTPTPLQSIPTLYALRTTCLCPINITCRIQAYPVHTNSVPTPYALFWLVAEFLDLEPAVCAVLFVSCILHVNCTQNIACLKKLRCFQHLSCVNFVLLNVLWSIVCLVSNNGSNVLQEQYWVDE